MQLKTILNRVERHKSLVYGEPRWVDSTVRLSIEVPIEPRANGRPICSGCRKPRPGYDRLQPRRFEFVPLWQIAVVFVYALRRVDCPICGVVVEQVPWASGKSRLTTTYQWFLAGWARRLSWKEVATVFNTTWEHVRNSVHHAVAWSLVHRDLAGVEAIGVDEIQWRRGHHYLTLVYQIDAGCKRLLWIGRERTEDCLRRGMELLGENFRAASALIPSENEAYLYSASQLAVGRADSLTIRLDLPVPTRPLARIQSFDSSGLK